MGAVWGLVSGAPSQLSAACIPGPPCQPGTHDTECHARGHKGVVPFLSLKLRNEDTWDLGQQKEAASSGREKPDPLSVVQDKQRSQQSHLARRARPTVEEHVPRR